MVATVAANVRYLARNVLGWNATTARLLGVRPGFAERLVDRTTDLCLEGFPRSGNSFLLKAFTTWNPHARVAHHLHVPAQVSRSVRFGVPCLVLVRRPEDAVTSLLVANPALELGLVLASYTAFHERVRRHLGAVVVASFEVAVAEPWEPVRQVNERFGTTFRAEVLDGAARLRFEDDLREWNARDRQPAMLVAVPSEQKERRKAAVAPAVRAHARFAAATRSYREVVGG